jgi:hypothetical protein
MSSLIELIDELNTSQKDFFKKLETVEEVIYSLKKNDNVNLKCSFSKSLFDLLKDQRWCIHAFSFIQIIGLICYRSFICMEYNEFKQKMNDLKRKYLLIK